MERRLLAPPRVFLSPLTLTTARPFATFKIPTGIVKVFRFLTAVPLPGTPETGIKLAIRLDETNRAASHGWMPVEAILSGGRPFRIRNLTPFDWNMEPFQVITAELQLPEDGSAIEGGYELCANFLLGPVYTL